MPVDDSPSLLTRGYGFGAHVWRRAADGARAVPMRFLLRDALLVRGAEGVELFYSDRIARHGAMPAIVQQTLFGDGSVHSLDGAEHRHRKATFVDVAYEDEQVARLTPLIAQEWHRELDEWLGGGQRSAYDAAVGVFGRAGMRWAGLPGTPDAKTRWAARLAQIVDGFGVPYSPEYLLAVRNRWWSNRHAERLVRAVRDGDLDPAEGTALYEWAWHRDRSGVLLPAVTAGVELQNSIRPLIAVARFVAFAAKELHDRPEWRARIAEESVTRRSLEGGPVATAFAQEVRRTAPFVPMLPGWATEDVELDGQRLASGGRVLLDLLGTDTDDRSWPAADRFDPDRFLGVDDYEAIETFVPHGGGDVATGHRCPGEKLAIVALASAVATLSDPRLSVLDEGLDVDRRRLPTKPASGGRVRASRSPGDVAGGRSRASGSGGCPFHRGGGH
ncbi:cytochrome P450 [Curtobacterium sp. MCPF17_031]|uniref:cytochrome P450 n=1 Tax=Curtobacterium sp. MCPF17_031 TaxID=2175653 RepID=UPI000DAA1562|nr:cytochrome P450 [Curtobacterium sp. MCPF17_031]PZE39668.1 cytochrome P450 [Curtobacterium sp. MCPF17_031]